ncbi:MAG TPA: hypothetical protein PLP28_15135, partial [Flavobacteriales bacterium]|nr:hypothetical protein [Flavobacteriales bacterium]
RYTQVYRGNSQVNGINLFNFADFRVSEHDLGSIQVMASAGDVIVCVCERGFLSFYRTQQPIEVGADYAMKVAGAFLASNRVSNAKVGCIHRQSVVVTPTGSVIFYDHNLGQLVQYASNEPIDISSPFRCGSFFRELGFTMPKDTKVVAGFDPSTKEVVLTFARHVADDGYQQYDIDGKSILYHDQSNTFVCKTLDTPDVWATAAASLWAFADGKLWNVGHPSAPLNFRFGVQRDLSVTLVAAYPGLNPNSPHKITVWRDGGWSVSRVTGANGGDSEIPPSKFEIDGSGRTGAAFMNDRSSPRNQQGRGLSTGAYLMDIAYLVELSHPGPEPCHLFQVEIGLETVQG